MIFEGYCYRGPYDGLQVAHQTSCIEVLTLRNLASDEPTWDASHYRYLKHPPPFRGGAWIWEPPPK